MLLKVDKVSAERDHDTPPASGSTSERGQRENERALQNDEESYERRGARQCRNSYNCNSCNKHCNSYNTHCNSSSCTRHHRIFLVPPISFTARFLNKSRYGKQEDRSKDGMALSGEGRLEVRHLMGFNRYQAVTQFCLLSLAGGGVSQRTWTECYVSVLSRVLTCGLAGVGSSK